MNEPKQTKITLTTTKTRNKISRFPRRTTSRKITIVPSKERLLRNLLRGKFCDNNYFPIGLRSWAQFDEFEIVLKYRRIFIGIANYYSNTDSRYILNRVSYILQYSCAKTLAVRKKISMAQVFKIYGSKLTITRTLTDNDQSTKVQTVKFSTYTDLKKETLIFTNKRSALPDYDPFKIEQYWRTKMKTLFYCSICGSKDRIALHHTNSLRSIKPNKRDNFEYIRSRLNRLQVHVCFECHKKITNGTFNNANPPEFDASAYE